MSESSFDLQSWLQQHGVSAEQASGRLFCKWLPADQLERLQAEAEGLDALIPCAGALVVPRPWLWVWPKDGPCWCSIGLI